MMKEAIPFDMYATGAVDLQAAASTKVAGGRYALRRMLGRGGMGIVWLAFDERLQREVALKFLPPQIRYDAVALDDLRRETARSQRLTHPNIVRIHDLYEAENEDAFISMEYVDGPHLGTIRVQQSERVLSWSYLEPLVPQLCEALEYAHAEGIIHRDLKPANVMVEQSGRVKLADFGIARAVTDTMSNISISKTTGTLLYMSPQQLEGGLPKVTDDIYGLGATLYELLTSKPPFYAGDLPHQVRNVVAKPPKDRLRELKLTNEIPSYIEDLVMACLNKSDTQRPQRAGEVAAWVRTRQRPLGKSHRVGIGTRMVAAVSSLVRTRPAWCFGGATGLAAIATVVAVVGHPHGKVEARDIGQNPQSRSGSHTPQTIPVKPSQPAFATVSLKGAPAPASGPARAPLPPFVPKPADRTTNVSFATASGGASGPGPLDGQTTSPVKPVATPVTSPAQRPAPVLEVAAATVPPAPATPTQVSQPQAVSSPAVVALPPAAVSTPGAAPPPPKPATALQLARQGNAHVSERSRNKVVEIISGQAPIDSQPQDWRVIYYDPKARYRSVEVQFEGGKMARVHEPARILEFLSPSSQKPLDFDKLKIDSDEALRITLALPEVGELKVRSAQFDLDKGYGGAPVWEVRLFGGTASEPAIEKALGYAIILADDGKVLKETFSKKTPRRK